MRAFCDQCGVELQKDLVADAVKKRIKRQFGVLRVEVIVGTTSAWNSGNACVTCVVGAVLNGRQFDGGS